MLSDCLHLELVQRSLELINGPEQEAICDAARTAAVGADDRSDQCRALLRRIG